MSDKLAALRLARREAWRHKGRNLLIISMLGLPVMGLTAGDVIARTMRLTPTERVTRDIGQADAGIRLLGGRIESQSLLWSQGSTSRGTSGADAIVANSKAFRRIEPRVLAALPSGSTTTLETTATDEVDANGRALVPQIIGLDLANPIARGIAQITRGRPPAGHDVDISSNLAKRLDIGIGSSIEILNTPYVVGGFASDLSQLNQPLVFAAPTDVPHGEATLLVDTHGVPVTLPILKKLNAVNGWVESRALVADPPSHGLTRVYVDHTHRAEVIGIATVAIGLAILDAVLLAGAAFAVGARREERDLGLLGATGADARQIRDVVLAGGLVLGVAGAILGIALGVLGARLAMPEVAHLYGAAAGAFTVRPLDLVAIAAIGLVAGVAAATLPARRAGQFDVVAALTGRRVPQRISRNVPVIGLAMAIGGGLLASYSARPPAKFWLVLIGAVVGEVGFVVCAPAIVALAGRAARIAPLPMRLALRDADRHRGRTGPAVAAIMAAVAGLMATAVYFQSEQAQQRRDFVPQYRVGESVLQVGGSQASARKELVAAQQILDSTLGSATLTPLTDGHSSCVISCGSHPRITIGQGTCHGCVEPENSVVGIGGAAQLSAILGHQDPSAASVLSNGGVVFFDQGVSGSGKATLTVDGKRHEQVPAQFVSMPQQYQAPGGMVSPATAARIGLRPITNAYSIGVASPPDVTAVDRANDALRALPGGLFVTTERGYQDSSTSFELLALALAAAIVTLGATGIVTGLSAAESRDDLATFGAVGAAPRTRRVLVASQAAVVALLGTTTGVVSGTVSAFAIIGARGGEALPFTIPWRIVGELVVAVPLIAALCVGAVVRSRLPAERRFG